MGRGAFVRQTSKDVPPAAVRAAVCKTRLEKHNRTRGCLLNPSSSTTMKGYRSGGKPYCMSCIARTFWSVWTEVVNDVWSRPNPFRTSCKVASCKVAANCKATNAASCKVAGCTISPQWEAVAPVRGGCKLQGGRRGSGWPAPAHHVPVGYDMEMLPAPDPNARTTKRAWETSVQTWRTELRVAANYVRGVSV